MSNPALPSGDDRMVVLPLSTRQVVVGRDGGRLLPARYDRPDPGYPTLAEIETRFLSAIEGTHSPRTVETYTQGLRHFNRFLLEMGIDVRTSAADPLVPNDVLDDFLGWLRSFGCKPRTVQVYVAGALACWRFATAKGLVPPRFRYDKMRDSLGFTKGPNEQRRAPALDRAIVLVVPYVDNLPLPDRRQRGGIARLELLRDRALLHTLFYTGARRAEAASLNRSDVRDGYAPYGPVIGKGRRERTMYFDADTQSAIRAYLEERNDTIKPLFLRHDNRRGTAQRDGENWRLSAQSVWAIVKRYAAAVGADFGPHAFRHLKARTLLNRGAALDQVQDILGYASHRDDQAGLRKVRAADPRQDCVRVRRHC
jgi:site-specific recombinase XerD